MQAAFAANSLKRATPKLARRAPSVAIAAGSSSVRQQLDQLARSIGVQIVPESSKHDVLLLGVDSHSALPQTTAGLKLLTDQTDVCILCTHDATPIPPVSRLLQASISAILPINIDSAQFRAAIEAVQSGLQVVHPSFLHERHGSGTRVASPEELTDREQQVLAMMADGHGNKEIAACLGISTHTVKFHISSILGKLGAGSRTEAVSIGMRTGKVLI